MPCAVANHSTSSKTQGIHNVWKLGIWKQQHRVRITGEGRRPSAAWERMNGDPFSVRGLCWRREMLYRVLGREVKVPRSRGQRNVMFHVRLKSGDLARYAAPLDYYCNYYTGLILIGIILCWCMQMACILSSLAESMLWPGLYHSGCCILTGSPSMCHIDIQSA